MSQPVIRPASVRSVVTRLVRTFLVFAFSLFFVAALATPASAQVFSNTVPPAMNNSPEWTEEAVDNGQVQDPDFEFDDTSPIDALAGWIVSSASDAMDFALNYLDIGTAPVIDNPNCDSGGAACWFADQYTMMKAVGIWVLLPLIFIATIHAVAKGSLNTLLKIWLVFLPIAVIGAAVAVKFVQLLLDVTDDFSRAFLGSTGEAAEAFLTATVGNLDDMSFWLAVLFGIGMIVVCIAVYIVLVLREASIYIATSFLPIGFAMMVWPSTARFFRKMVEFLIAMIFSKLVMVAGISLAMASIASAATGDASLALGGGATVATGAAADSGWQQFGNVIQALVMFVVVAASPSMTMRLVGNAGLGEAAAAVGAHMDRPTSVPQTLAFFRGQAAIKDFKGTREANALYKGNQAWVQNTSAAGYALERLDIHRNNDGDFSISQKTLDANEVPAQFHAEIMALSRTENPNDQAVAHAALQAGEHLTAIDHGTSGTFIFSNVYTDEIGANQNTGTMVLPITDANGTVIQRHDEATVVRATNEMIDKGAQRVHILNSAEGRAPKTAAHIERLRQVAAETGAVAGVRASVDNDGYQQVTKSVQRAPEKNLYRRK